MKKNSRLSVISLTVSAASLLIASTAFAAHADYKNEVYKGEPVAVAPVPCPILNCLQDGAYVGAGLGYDAYKVRQSITVNDGVGSGTSFNPSLSARGFNGSIFAGYGQYYDRFYIAGEVSALSTAADMSYGMSNQDISFGTKLTARASYGVAILPGLKVNDSTLVYIRLGYVRTSFKSQENETIPAFGVFNRGVSKSTWGNGLNYGIGVETAVCRNVSVRGEYNYINYNSFNSPVGTKFAPSNNQFVISGIYHFA